MTPKLIAMRFPHKVTILDVRGQGFNGVRAVARAVEPIRVRPENVMSCYFNQNTGRQNVNIHFLSERLRVEALDFIDETFRHYRVH